MFRKRKPLSPAIKIQTTLRNLLEEEGLWLNELVGDIPKSWEKYGDFLLFNGEKCFRHSQWSKLPNLWSYIAQILNVNRIALRFFIQNDSFRSPRIKMVLGDDSWVQYKDNGIVYTWNVQCNMFCAGNAPERHRIARLPCENEIIVDMYAGIGYFTLPYLVQSKARFVHACEWNPNAIKALKLNLSKNKVSDKCTVYEGDCNIVCPKHVADRVNLGLLPSSELSWKTACEALNPLAGGTLHIHENVTSGISNKGNAFFPSADRQTQPSCKKCLEIMNDLDLYPESDPLKTFFTNLENSSTFSFNCNSILLSNDINIKWKKVEWKIWALHVNHKFSDIFKHMDGNAQWQTSITFLHHVKSYAPHIDHLVLDLKCSPLE